MTQQQQPMVRKEDATIELTASKFAFDKDTITVKAGSEVTINFHNKDDGVPHNFALYSDSSLKESFFKGEIFEGMGDRTYRFTAPSSPGDYFFRCDVHPMMNGTFRCS